METAQRRENRKALTHTKKVSEFEGKAYSVIIHAPFSPQNKIFSAMDILPSPLGTF